MSDAAEMMTSSKVLEEDTKVQAHGAASAAGAVPVGGDQPDSFKPASRPQHDTPPRTPRLSCGGRPGASSSGSRLSGESCSD